ncbi:O-methyltransferase [Pseudozyma hubeiensis]|nr:O-methyltransferase [Pseudozyma hubeiensis]
MTDSFKKTILYREYPEAAQLVTRLHELSEQQDAQGTGISSLNDQNVQKRDFSMYKHKMVALEQDKSELIYAVLRNKNARRIFEAGTSYGVSTIYLLLASQAADAKLGKQDGPDAMVWGTEKEEHKADAAMANLAQAMKLPDGTKDIPGFTMLRGDILELAEKASIETDSLDAVLFDIWAEMALPTFKLLEASLKPDAVIFIDNWLTGLEIGTYTKLHEYLESKEWYVVALPFKNGLGMATRVDS